MSTLPQQVREQVEEADRIAKEMQEAANAQEQEQEQPVEQSFDTSPAEEESPDEQDEVQAAEEEKPAAAVTEEEDPNSDTYKQRWKSLDGQIKAEKRRNQELMGRIEGLENMLAQLQELRATEPAEQEQAQSKAVEQLLSKQEIEEYGSDLIDVMKRAAREAVKSDFEALQEENAQLKRLVGGVGQKQELSDRDRFYSRLENKVPNWEQLNTDPNFLGWLEEADVYAGETRHALLTKAFQANDVNRVARFFEGYLNETAAVAEVAAGGQSQGTQAESKPSVGKKVSLEKLAAPGVGSSGSADNTSQNSGRMWKESDIGAFYEDARKGKFKGREADYRRTEQEIQTALKSGNILLGQ